MPVNFTTPDPGIIERPYVQQIPLDALFKNMAYGQAKYDQNLQEAQRSIDTLRNIKTFGHDTEIKNEMFAQLDKELASFSGADFRDANVKMQLDSLIDNFTRTRDISGMHARGSTFEKMQKEAENARLKGEEYYNPGYDEALRYYNDGVYRTNVRFKDEGNIAPDFSKLRESILKMPYVTYKRSEKGPNGDIYTYDVVDEEKAAQTYKEHVEQDPKFSKYIKYKFEAQHPETDWQQKGREHFENQYDYYSELAYQEQRAYNAAMASGNVGNAAYHKQAAEKAQAKVGEYETVLRAADENLGVDFKGLWFDEFKEEQAKNFGKTKFLLALSKIDKDPAYLKNLEHANNMAEIEFRQLVEGSDFGEDGHVIPGSYDKEATELKKDPEAVQDWARFKALDDAFRLMARKSTWHQGEALVRSYVQLYDPAVKKRVADGYEVQQVQRLKNGTIRVIFKAATNGKVPSPVTVSPETLKVMLGTSAKYQQGAALKKFDFQQNPDYYGIGNKAQPPTDAGEAP